MKPGGYSYGGGGAAAAFVVGLLCAHAVTGVGLESGERGARCLHALNVPWTLRTSQGRMP